MMDLAGLAGLDDDPGQGALAPSDEVMVHCRGGQQCRDRHPIGRGRAVGQDQDVVTGLYGLGGLAGTAALRAGAMPSAPSAAGQVASSVSVRNAGTSVSIAWIFCRSPSVRIG